MEASYSKFVSKEELSSLLQVAADLCTLGKVSEARAIALNLLKAVPDNQAIICVLAITFIVVDEFQKAEELLKPYVEREDICFDECYGVMALCCALQKDMEGAKKYSSRIKSDSPASNLAKIVSSS